MFVLDCHLFFPSEVWSLNFDCKWDSPCDLYVLQAISGAKMLGATKIIGIDKNEMKREKGEAFGMTDFIKAGDSAKSVSELVKEMSGGMGVDYLH